MNELMNILLPILTIVLLIVLLSVTVFRVPITSTKVSFGFFAFFLFLWNVAELLNLTSYFQNSFFELIRITFSCLTLYSLLVAGLHFPFFRRREVFINIFTTFLGGMGFFLLTLVFSIPYIIEYFPLESRFYQSFNFFLVKVYSVFCLFSFFMIVIYKLTLSTNFFRKYSYRTISYVILFILFLFIINYFLTLDLQLLKNVIGIIFFDSLFLICILITLLQFKFISFYPGLLSYFMYGEIPKLIIQTIAPSNPAGAAELKKELWKIYERENWKAFLNEFWFSIIIDETLDNAVEHGGRRWEDMITVQIFETSKFLDLYVIDSGKGFEPKLVPNPLDTERKDVPSGRGIHIMKQLFEVSWNFLGNEIKIKISKDPKKNPQEN